MSPAVLNLNQLARISAASMLNCMLQGIAIGLFAWILLRLMGRRNSSTRFAVWFAALLTIAALPVLGVAASSARAGSAGSAITVPGSWALDIFFVWAVIAGAALLRVGVGLWQLRKLRAICPVVDPETLDPVLRGTLQEFQSVRSVTLCQSDCLRVPTAIGFLQPVVVVPTWALQELSTAELNSILIHELAHLRRRDDWTNLAQQVLKALLFFHPAVWWIESQISLEREMACDDTVLATTSDPRGYAQCLISVAEKSFMRRGLALAQAAVNRMRQTSLRVAQILDVNRSGAIRIWKPALFSVAAFSVACLVSLSRAPELVAFEDRLPEVAIAPATNQMLTSATASNSFENQVIATPVSFHPKSAPEELVRAHRIQKAASSLVQVHQVAKGKSLFVHARRIGKGKTLLAQEIGKGTSSLVPLQAVNNPRLQPLRRDFSIQASFSAASGAVLDLQANPQQNSASLLEAHFVVPEAGMFSQAGSTIIGHGVTQQAVFVVMQSAQYDEAGPMLWRISVWRVTILDSSRIPGRTRIPAKQI
jgi:beta-lactamase regulating signal transducer with metallopeptidase domain